MAWTGAHSRSSDVAVAPALPFPRRGGLLASVLIDVLPELEGVVLLAERLGVELFDRAVRRRASLAHRLEEDVVAFEVGDRLLQAGRSAVGADLFALGIVECVRIDGHGGRQREAAFDAIQSRGNHAGEGEV